MSCVDVTGEFGIIIRRRSLVERDVSLHSILEVLEVKGPVDMNDELLSFGPSVGQEALAARSGTTRQRGHCCWSRKQEGCFCGPQPKCAGTREGPSARSS
jgi:hypothetical protein